MIETDKVKTTERGWPGHFICANRCRFRRNTLLEYRMRKIVVSTVGSLFHGNEVDEKMSTVGPERWYETMVFEAEKDGPYWDIDVEKEIFLDSEWGVWADSIDKLPEDVDNVANDMHEKIVQEIEMKLLASNGKLPKIIKDGP